MKTAIFTLCMISLLCVSSSAQNLVQNGGFESFLNPISNCYRAFQSPSGSPYWYNSHGSPRLSINPSLYPGSTNCFAFSGGGQASVHSGDVFADLVDGGIFQNLSLLCGRTYSVSFWVRSFGGGSEPGTLRPVDFYLEAVNGLQESSSDALPNVQASDRQEIYHSPGSIVNSYQQITLTFKPTKNFSQIWFRGIFDINHDEVFLDDIEISDISNTILCDISNLKVDNISNPGPVAVSSNSTHYVNISTSCNAPSYTFSATGGNGDMNLNITGANGGNCQINVSGNTGSKYLHIVATGNCITNTRDVTFYIPSGYRVAPNPAKDNMTVIFDNTSYQEALPDQLELVSEKEGKPIQSVDVKDMFTKKSFKEGNQIVFDIHNYPRGIYYLRVINPRQTDDKKVDVIRLVFE